MTIDILYILLFISLCVIGFSLRSLLIIKFGWVGKDTFYHLLAARQIRNIKKIPNTIDRFVEPEQYDYPPLFHILLSFFPEKFLKKIQIIAPLADVVSIIIIFIFCYILVGPWEALAAAAIYSVTPFAIDWSFSLGPRVFANLFLIICLITTFLLLDSSNTLYLPVAVIFSACVMLTQRLAVQSMVAVLLAMSIVYMNYYPLLVLILALLLSLIISKMYYLKVLRGHIDFIRVLGKRLLDPKTRREQASPVLQIKPIIFNLPIIGILAILPFLSIMWMPIITFSLIWVIGLIIISILWVFGEGYRHMANAVAPLAIICGVWLANVGEVVTVIIVVSMFLLCIYKVNRLAKKREMGLILSPNILTAFQYILANGEADDVILTLPTDFSYHAAYFTGMITAHSSGGFAKGLAFNSGINQMINEGRVSEVIDQLRVKWVVTLNENVQMSKFEIHRSWNNIFLYRISNS